MERVVQSGPVSLALEEAGDGIPVVLLHGLTATRRYVVMGSRALERSGHRVVAYDARGHGGSAPAPSYSYPDLTADLAAVLNDLQIPRAVLAGASMGAHTIARFASEAPERVSAAVLVTPAFDPDAPEDPAALARWDALAEGLRTGGVEGFVAAYDAPDVPEAWRDTVVKVLRQRLSAHDHPDAVADALEQVPRSRPFKSWDALRALDIPAVVVGSRDEPDPGHPLAIAERWSTELPHARLLVEDPGKSPLAWQGGQLSRVIAEAAGEVR
ncbi:MAG TPA: alpha/beta fold hydrolase [Solirubrobacteraceae bacterium]|nr:alpha/beta fold hydrolase [Solirubrobacteraceae bacterium]